MNRGVLQNSPVQQMMATGNSNLWNINNLMRPPFISSSSSSSLSPSSSSTTNFLAPPPYNINHNNNYHYNHNNHTTNNNLYQADQLHMNSNTNNMSTAASSSWLDDHHPNEQHTQQLHESWSQFLLDGVFMGEEAKKIKGWEEQVILQHHPSFVDVVKQESSVNSYSNNSNNNNNVYSHEQEFHQVAAAKATNWSPQISSIIPASSPQSCVTTTLSSNNNNLLDFSSKSTDNNLHSRHHLTVPDHSSECNSTATGGALKKTKVQPSSSTQSTFKVRKEKLGDRITSLHQLVSPFGKTDTASVLLEAIGYIRFLQSQIEALSLPYLSNGEGNKRQSHNVVQEGEKKCIFPEDPGQLFHENCLKRKGGPEQDLFDEEPAKDLRSRGLCLVPLSSTMHVGSDNGADYWAPAALGGGFR